MTSETVIRLAFRHPEPYELGDPRCAGCRAEIALRELLAERDGLLVLLREASEHIHADTDYESADLLLRCLDAFAPVSSRKKERAA